jgi:hypothetical protein
VRAGLLLRNPAKDRARRRIVGRSGLPMAAPESPRDFALPDLRALSRLVERVPVGGPLFIALAECMIGTGGSRVMDVVASNDSLQLIFQDV